MPLYRLLYLLCIFACPVSPALAEVRTITDDAALRAALASGVAGDTLVLAPGRYGPLVLRGDHGSAPAVIRSADPENPAEISGIQATRFQGLTLENLHLRYRFSTQDPLNFRPFVFQTCSDLRITATRLEGDEAHGLGTSSDGLPYAFGIGVRNCDGVDLIDLHISRFYRGLVVSRSQSIRITGSELTAIRMDGMNFAQVEDVLIESNYIHAFRRSEDPRDHADMIQFWTASTDWASRHIVIRNNVLNSGDGRYTQSIFMRNERADAVDGTDRSLYYHDIRIENNLIINAHTHGITVGEVIGLEVLNNTLIQNASSADGNLTRSLWQPHIRINPHSEAVRIAHNITHGIVGPEDQGDWQVVDNLLIQNTGRMDPGAHFSTVFEMSDPTSPITWQRRPDGPAGDTHLGASVRVPSEN